MQQNIIKNVVKPVFKAQPDYRLVMANLEKRILDGVDEEKTKKILASEEVWKRLDPELMLQWASLCQMAGCISAAESVYSQLHRISPDLEAAWERHFEMMDILGKSTDLLKLLEISRKSVNQAVHSAWMKRFAHNRSYYGEKDLDKAAKPFEEMRTRQNLADRFLELFSGRPDCFARQWADKNTGKSGYVPVRYAMRHSDLEAHFKGFDTCGIYLIHPDGTVKLGVIDADLKDSLREASSLKKNISAVKKEGTWLASRIIEISQKAGARPCVEFSGGKGYHFWYFFEEAVSAGQAKAALTNIAAQVKNDLECFQLEVFPKQDHLTGQGFGNLVKLPLGVHKKTGKRSYFYECPDRDVENQLAWLSKVKPGKLESVPEKTAKIELHPKFVALSEKWPELATLSSSCPPIGRLITACFSGNQISNGEEQILYQTIGFLPAASRSLHAVFGNMTDYNPHVVDLKISKLRGTPLGCRRIHSILGYTGDICPFPSVTSYPSPLLHLGIDLREAGSRSEKVESLSAAIENLRTAMEQVERFLK